MAGERAAGGQMAGKQEQSFWPLFGLVVRTPRLEIRLPREEEFGALLAVIGSGIHHPDMMPFTTPFTDRPSPERERESAQWWWRQRAEWSAEKWNLTGAVFVDGHVVGVQAILHLAFARLGAQEAHSGAFFDNAPSLATSRSVGYQPNGETLAPRRDGAVRMLNVRMDRATWEERRRDDIEIVGLEECRRMFIAAPAESPES